MRTEFIKTLTELAGKDSRICLLTGDLGFMVVEQFAKLFPSRFINVGVAEANMIGVATGMAEDGWIPYVYSIATFASMRAYEQLRNGPVIHSLPVRIVGIGGGFAYGYNGITHFALEDFAIMCTQPGLTVIAPADPLQTRAAMLATYQLKGPIYYRIGKGGNPIIKSLSGRFSPGRVELIGDGKDVLLLSTGGITSEVVEALALLEAKGIHCTVGVIATLSPTPVDTLLELVRAFPVIVSIEEHYIHGGLGSLVAEVIAAQGRGVLFRQLGVREIHLGLIGTESYMRERARLSSHSIAHEVELFVRNHLE